jgi:hypothetical protein
LVGIILIGWSIHSTSESPLDGLSISIHRHMEIFYSSSIFPIYQYNSLIDSLSANETSDDHSNTDEHTSESALNLTSSTKNPLIEVNGRVWPLFAIFILSYTWGVFSLFFMTNVSTGLAVSSASIVGFILLFLELKHHSQLQYDLLCETIDWLDEGSTLYQQVLRQCKWKACINQYLGDHSILLPRSSRPSSSSSDTSFDIGSNLPVDVNLDARLELQVDRLRRQILLYQEAKGQGETDPLARPWLLDGFKDDIVKLSKVSLAIKAIISYHFS